MSSVDVSVAREHDDRCDSSTLEFVVRTRALNVSSSKCAGSRLPSSFHKSWTDVEDGRGKQRVLGRPSPLKLVMSTLM